MRVSTAFKYSSLNSDISLADQTYVNIQQQLATGKSINQVSDDPYTGTLAITQTALSSRLSQYSSNLDYATSFLNQSDSALSSTNDIVNSAKSIAQQAANSSVDQTARTAMVSQIDQLEARLVDLGNTQGSTGEYIFGGQVTQKQPFTVTATGLTYNGDTNAVRVETGPNSTLQINTPGSPVFTDLYNNLETLKSDLQSGNLTALSNIDLTNLQNSQTTVLQLRGNVGAAVQTATADKTSNTSRTTELTTLVSNETDIDYAATVTKYQEAQSVYQAALSVTGSAFKLNLTSFLQ